MTNAQNKIPTENQINSFKKELQKGMDELLNFEEDLHQFKKDTVCLFITLVVNNENFTKTLDTLTSLEKLVDDDF